MPKARVDYERRFEIALRRILAYMTPAQLRRESEREYGLAYEESLEMAYENVRDEARAALFGYRRKKQPAPPLPDAGGRAVTVQREPLSDDLREAIQRNIDAGRKSADVSAPAQEPEPPE